MQTKSRPWYSHPTAVWWEVAGVDSAVDRGITTKEKSSHHQKKLKRLFRNHAYFYSMVQEVLDAEDEETERKVNSMKETMKETQMVCFLLEETTETTNPPTPCIAKRNKASAFSYGAGCQLGFGGLFVCKKKKSFCFVWKGQRGETLTFTFSCLISLPSSINTFFCKLWQLFGQLRTSVCLSFFKNEVQSFSDWLSLQSWIPSCLTGSLFSFMPAVYTLFASFSFGSKQGKDKMLLYIATAEHWAGGCWTPQDHALSAIVLLPFLLPGSSQILGELTISGLPNSIYVPAPKALKILTWQLLFKLLEGTYLPRQCHLPQHPQTQDNAHFLFSRPQKTPFSHVGFQSNIAAFFLPAAFVPIPGRRE